MCLLFGWHNLALFQETTGAANRGIYSSHARRLSEGTKRPTSSLGLEQTTPHPWEDQMVTDTVPPLRSQLEEERAAFKDWLCLPAPALVRANTSL